MGAKIARIAGMEKRFNANSIFSAHSLPFTQYCQTHFMKKTLLLLALQCTTLAAFAKLPVKFESSLGVGLYNYIHAAGNVDPGPDWKGYPLPRGGSAFQVFTNNGFVAFNRLHANIGLGYANYDGVNGGLAMANLAFDILTKPKLTPFVYANAGYSHVWNQYSGGTGSEVFELGLGGRYKLPGKHAVFLSGGSMVQHLNFYLGVKAGFTF
jgi:hypothetical protein